MPEELEKAIEQYLVNKVTEHGGFVRKYTSPGRRGVPDRIIFWNGAHFAELKRPKSGKLSKLQELEFARMAAQGVPVYVLWSKSDVDAFIWRML